MISQFPLIQISKLISKVATCDPKVFKVSSIFEYVDISSINRETKRIETTNQILVSEAPSRARQIINDGDILVSTVRPNLNAVAQVPTYLHNEIASTGFTVLRPEESKLDSRYLFHWVKNSTFVSYLEKNATGATYPAVTDKIVKDAKIPLPPLPEQKRISEVLDKADALREKRRLALQKLDTLLQSVFLEMFGDPVTNSMGWEVKELNEISTHILNGTTPKGGEQVYVEKGITFFRSQNVWRNRLSLDDIAFIDSETHRRMGKSSLKKNDILITKTGRINTENSSLGRATIFLGKDDSANINGHVYLVRLEDGNIHKFILFILTMDEYREYIRSVCVGGIDKRQINKEHLERFPIIFPPLDLQRRFAAVIELAEQQKARQRVSLKKLDDLFASLQSRAFKGELFNDEFPTEEPQEEKVWQQTPLF